MGFGDTSAQRTVISVLGQGTETKGTMRTRVRLAVVVPWIDKRLLGHLMEQREAIVVSPLTMQPSWDWRQKVVEPGVVEAALPLIPRHSQFQGHRLLVVLIGSFLAAHAIFTAS